MTETVSYNRTTDTMPYTRVPANTSEQQGLFFKIVCDPGHERTVREMSALSKESREKVWADLSGETTGFVMSKAPAYGATSQSAVEEDSEYIQDCLHHFDVAIQGLARTTGLQLGLNTSLGHDAEFRLGFLRAEEFDPIRAAQRFQRHFDQKVALFGVQKVGDTIRLSDLSPEDMESLESGGLQILPKTDRAGRLVVVSRYREFKYQHKENLLRALWYMIMSVYDMPSLSRVSMVFLGYEVGEYVPVESDLVLQIIRTIKNLPMKFVASHSCYSDSPLETVLDLLVHMLRPFARLRLRLHHGSHQECMYRLMTIGIPISYLPITMDGVLRRDNHIQWLQFRRQQEHNTPNLIL
eukprot:Nitzschia sp. Nitz4//scaffold12_size214221//47638//48898//NITZ4_001487-RA/size214221-snap-gene-0.112-mRNA-1//-1//CDS//3329534981//8367//frame0